MSNNSIILGHFLPASLLQQLAPIRRLTSTSSDSEDSGVDPSYRQERKIFVEEAFIIYDRYSGRHRGFGFVTFADMATTKMVCSTRIFNLHGRKIECKRALKRKEILAANEGDSNDYKSFRPNNICSSLSSPVVPTSSNVPLCPPAPPSIPFPYGQYGQLAPAMINSPGGWIMNPSMQSIPQMFHPMFNPHQQYAVFPLSSLMSNNPYQKSPMQTPFIQELMIPSSSSMMNV